MAPIKQCVVYPMFKPESMSLADLCREASRIGYAAIEMWGRKGGPGVGEDDASEVVELARSHGLQVASLAGHNSLEDGLNNPANHDRSTAELAETIELAQRLGIPNTIAYSGNRRAGQSDLEGMVECARALRRAAPMAEKAGVNINVELLNSRVDHPGYLADHADWGMALCEMVASPNVRLLFDVYHMQIMDGDVIRWLQTAMPRVGHIHTAGNPGRRDMDDNQELNYRGICRSIASSNYEGFVGHELEPAGDVVAALEQTFALCDV